jgi:hypothetical protein
MIASKRIAGRTALAVLLTIHFLLVLMAVPVFLRTSGITALTMVAVSLLRTMERPSL